MKYLLFVLMSSLLTKRSRREAKEAAEAKERYMKVREHTGDILACSVVDCDACSSMLRVRQSRRRRTSLD